jgi:hypothetical protein
MQVNKWINIKTLFSFSFMWVILYSGVLDTVEIVCLWFGMFKRLKYLGFKFEALIKTLHKLPVVRRC